MKILLQKLKEPSTYRGLAILGGAVGVSLDPSAWETIGMFVASIVGLIEVFRKEK